MGIEATSVVIADDENIKLAKKLGFEVVRRDNKFLGQKFNDGYQLAAELGADFVVPLGSDSWIHHTYFKPLKRLKADKLLTGKHYGLIDETGLRLGKLEITVADGVGPHVIALEWIKPFKYRPVKETLTRGCDGSLLSTIRKRKVLECVWNNSKELQYVAFRTEGQQLNPYKLLADKYLRNESRDPWGELKTMYPPDLVEETKAVYDKRRRR